MFSNLKNKWKGLDRSIRLFIALLISIAISILIVSTSHSVQLTPEQAVASKWNLEFSKINNMRYDYKSEPISQKSYFMTIYQNNRDLGGSFYKLPGEVTAPQVTPVKPTETCTCKPV